MITFLEKTWYLWWVVVIVVGLRWHHVLVNGQRIDSARGPTQDSEILNPTARKSSQQHPVAVS